MDGEYDDPIRNLQHGIDRIENMLHRALHGSEPDTAGIYKRLDRIEQEAAGLKAVVKWVGGIVAAGLTAVGIKIFGGE